MDVLLKHAQKRFQLDTEVLYITQTTREINTSQDTQTRFSSDEQERVHEYELHIP